MAKHLQRDLDRLRQHILDLAERVQAAIRNAILALRTRDVPLAEEVIGGDDDIDEEENYVEEECLKVLALHQPVAVDLRYVTTVLLINTDLERMADLAANIAERALVLARFPAIPVPADLQRMTDLTSTLVRQAIDAFVNLDAKLARTVCRLDDEVDRHNKTIIGELIRLMRGSPDMVEPGLSFFSATRHLERIADHATNIAEDVIYLVGGEIVRHRPSAMCDE
ncbi:MAG TPA: phosphate signaling complex protein PhoU [Gemmataceae bacterium]|nr:phosphate signaling complex protein PhoU [Gemmataceae bacterium]